MQRATLERLLTTLDVALHSFAVLVAECGRPNS